VSAHKPINSHGVEVGVTELLEFEVWGYRRAGHGELGLSEAGLLQSGEHERLGSTPSRAAAVVPPPVGHVGGRGMEQEGEAALL